MAKAVTSTVPHGGEPLLEDTSQLHPPLSSEDEGEDGGAALPWGPHLPLGSHTFGLTQSSLEVHELLQRPLQTYGVQS